jgi:hypothetical protein
VRLTLDERITPYAAMISKSYLDPQCYAGRMTLFDLLTQTAKADTELLRSHNKWSDVLSVPREVDFSFETQERDRAKDFAEFVNGKQYGVAKITKLEDGQFRVLVLITMPITQHLICSVSGFVVCLSRLFQVDYQGWGSIVQRP